MHLASDQSSEFRVSSSNPCLFALVMPATLLMLLLTSSEVSYTPFSRLANMKLRAHSTTGDPPRARRGERAIELFAKEFQILDYLVRHAGQVVTRTMMLEAVWDYGFDTGTNVIDVHISRLRAKIDHPGERPLLHTVRGAGYRLDAR